MEDLSLHILDIVENSIAAGASKIQIKVTENMEKNLLLIEISDNGSGMDEETLKMADDPFFTTKKTRRVGLGISFLSQAARESGGDITIKSKKGTGTYICARFQHDHIDRKPLGDIEKTLTILITANPEIDFIYRHKRNKHSFSINTSRIKKELGKIPLTHPKAIKFIKDSISKWLKDTKSFIV
jgi:anti-sigma regulatory factor (Ser/Thr protein kinase)